MIMPRPKGRKPGMSYKTPVDTVPVNSLSFIEVKSMEYVKWWNESDALERRASKLMLDFLNRYKEDSEGAVSRIDFIWNKLKYYEDFQLVNKVKRELRQFQEQAKKQ